MANVHRSVVLLFLLPACFAYYPFGQDRRGRGTVDLEGIERIGTDSIDGAGEILDDVLIEIDEPPPVLRGGGVWRAHYAVTSARTDLRAQIQIARDGATVSDVYDVELDATDAELLLPVADTEVARARLIVADSFGNVAAEVTGLFAIDSTPAAIPPFVFDVGDITNHHVVYVFSAGCGDAVSLALTESDQAPTAGWAPCIEAARADPPSITLTDQQGDRTIRVWTMDRVGNVSTAPGKKKIVLDTVPPDATLLLPDDGALLGIDDPIAWTSSDLHLGAAPVVVEVSRDSGASYAGLGMAQAAIGMTTLAGVAPSPTARVRILVTDLAGNATMTGNDADVSWDDIRPAPPPLTLVSAALTASTGVTVSLTSCSDTPSVLISEAGTMPAKGATGFTGCTTANRSLGITGDGVHTLYAWGKDANGNVSATASTVSVELDTSPPAVALLAPSTGVALAPGIFNVTWTASDAHFTGTPVALSLSTDGGANYGPAFATVAALPATFAWTVTAPPNTSQARVRLVATDALGLQATVDSGDFAITSLPPGVSGVTSECSTNSGAPSSLPIVKTTFSASDAFVNITHHCLLLRTNPPTSNDPCWVPLGSPAKNITVTDFPFRLGFLPKASPIRAYTKNVVGLISAAGQVACFHDPGTPPVVTNVAAFSSDAPSTPYVPSDVTVAAGADVYVTWNATFTNPAGATPISFEYTTDDVAWAPGPTGLTNGANGACAVKGGQTGCYQWVAGAPTGSFFRVRVFAEDTHSLRSVRMATPPNNAPGLNFLAGNPETGVGGSALSTTFSTQPGVITRSHLPGRLVVSKEGVVYFSDPVNGVFWVDPLTGTSRFVVRYGAAEQDGVVESAAGPGTATLIAGPDTMLTIDGLERLWIRHNTTILRVEVNPVTLLPTTVTKVLGGGSDVIGQGVSPALVAVWPDRITALPNGDLIFMSDAHGFRVLHEQTQLVDSVRFSGTQDYGGGPVDLTACDISDPAITFDPVTSAIRQIAARGSCLAADFATFGPTGAAVPNAERVIAPSLNFSAGFIHFTGRDGERYLYEQYGLQHLYRYNLMYMPDHWEPILGSGFGPMGYAVFGMCPEADEPLEVNRVLPLACKTEANDVFVDGAGIPTWVSYGKIYGLDPGGKVTRLMGQGLDFGDGASALSVRIPRIDFIQRWLAGGGDDRVLWIDGMLGRIKEARIAGLASTIAGNGRSGGANVDDVVTPPNQKPIYAYAIQDASPSFAVDPSNGDLYYAEDLDDTFLTSQYLRYVRSTNRWQRLVGATGATNSFSNPSTDGQPGALILPDSVYRYVLGINSGQLFVGASRRNGLVQNVDAFLKNYALADGTQTHVSGHQGFVSNEFCDGNFDGAGVSVDNKEACTMSLFASFPSYPAVRDGAKWLVMSQTGEVMEVADAPGTKIKKRTPPLPALSWAYRRVSGSEEVFYYCHSGTGRLFELRFDAGHLPLQNGTVTELPWNLPTARCTYSALLYVPDRGGANGSLIFGYTQNGYYGIAELTALP